MVNLQFGVCIPSGSRSSLPVILVLSLEAGNSENDGEVVTKALMESL